MDTETSHPATSPTATSSPNMEATSKISSADEHMLTPTMSTENALGLRSISTCTLPSESANETEDDPRLVQPDSDAAKAITIPFKQFVDVTSDWGKGGTGAWRGVMDHYAKLLAEGAPLLEVITRECLQVTKEALESMNEGAQPVYQYLQQALGHLGDILRLPNFRTAFGKAGIIDFCLEVISQRGGIQATKSIVRQALRVVGNAVIDNDENRARVVAGNYTKVLTKLLEDPDLAPLALYVLNNVCDSNEAAQVQAAQNGLAEALISNTLDPELGNEALVTMGCTLVELASRHAEATESSPNGILVQLGRLAQEPDLSIEDFLTITNAVLNYLKIRRFQEAFVKEGAVMIVFLIVRHENLEKFNDILPEEAQELSRNCLALISAISDCSDLPIFAERYSFQRLRHAVPWFMEIKNGINAQLLGCILAGNYVNSEESCKEVIEANVHIALAKVVMESSDARVLHSALSALKNLAVPPAFRTQLSKTGIFDAAARIFTMSIMPQVQLVSVSLIRLLITNNSHNIFDHLLGCSPTSEITNAPNLSAILVLFSSTDSLPVRLEIGRTIAELFRSLGSLATPQLHKHETVEEAYSQIHVHTTVLHPVAAMLTQTQYLSLRSEAIFILALISRRKDGCVAVSELLKDANVFEVLVEALTRNSKEKSEEGAESGVGAKDRENAIVLGVEMVRNGEGGAWLEEKELEVLLKKSEEDKVKEAYEKLKKRVGNMKGERLSGRIEAEDE